MHRVGADGAAEQGPERGGIQSERILQQSSLGKNFTRAPGQRLQHPPQRGSGEAKGGEERLRERGGGNAYPSSVSELVRNGKEGLRWR